MQEKKTQKKRVKARQKRRKEEKKAKLWRTNKKKNVLRDERHSHTHAYSYPHRARTLTFADSKRPLRKFGVGYAGRERWCVRRVARDWVKGGERKTEKKQGWIKAAKKG